MATIEDDSTAMLGALRVECREPKGRVGAVLRPRVAETLKGF